MAFDNLSVLMNVPRKISAIKLFQIKRGTEVAEFREERERWRKKCRWNRNPRDGREVETSENGNKF